MTGLLSLRDLEPTVRRMLRRGDVGYAIFDVDHIRRINDSFSVHAGDAAICKLGELIAGAAPDGSEPFRVGGDELAVVIHGSADEAVELGERVRVRFEAVKGLSYSFMECSRGPLNDFTCSVGVSSAPKGGDAKAFEQLLARAELALDDAKRSGRNQVCLVRHV